MDTRNVRTRTAPALVTEYELGLITAKEDTDISVGFEDKDLLKPEEEEEKAPKPNVLTSLKNSNPFSQMFSKQKPKEEAKKPMAMQPKYRLKTKINEAL